MSTEAPAPVNGTPPGQFDWSGAQKIALGAMVAGFALYAIVGVINNGQDHEHGMTSLVSAFLAGWVYWVSLPIGATALLMVHYLAKTSWGVLLRRFLEAATRTFPLMIVLFIPMALAAVSLGEHSPYWWVDAEHKHVEPIPPPAPAPAGDAALEAHERKLAERREAAEKMEKHAVDVEREEHSKGNFSFLSPTGYIGLSLVYFAIWGTLAFFLNKWGQDIESDPTKVESSLEKLKNISGPGLILHAIPQDLQPGKYIAPLRLKLFEQRREGFCRHAR